MAKTAKKAPEMGRRTRRAEVAAEAFEARYSEYQYTFVEFLVSHLCDVGRAFDGDLQSVLVLAVIGQATLAAGRAAAAEGLSAADQPAERASTSASRIADVTGIPRETVRRKLMLLQARGWIAARPDGAWHLVVDADGAGSPARRHFEDVDRRTRRSVARLVAELEQFAEKPGR